MWTGQAERRTGPGLTVVLGPGPGAALALVQVQPSSRGQSTIQMFSPSCGPRTDPPGPGELLGELFAANMSGAPSDLHQSQRGARVRGVHALRPLSEVLRRVLFLGHASLWSRDPCSGTFAFRLQLG